MTAASALQKPEATSRKLEKARLANSFPLRWLPSACLCFLLFGVMLTTGCFSFRREAPRPGRTKLSSPLVVLPAQTLGSYLVIEAKWDRNGPYRFIIDTGSSVTLISPDLAKRYSDKDIPLPETPQVRVKSAEGGAAILPVTNLRRIELGEARFDNVPALVYDCAQLSAHLGVKIDGILGFPLFRETLLTLDYPHSRVLLTPAANPPLQPGATISFNNASRTPLIPIHVGDTTLIALIDSGSDAPLNLNPVGLHPNYATPPKSGGKIGTLSGDRTQKIGRLADTLTIGTYAMPQPLVEMTDELSSVGGQVLRNFIVTFNQEKSQVTFYRETTEPLAFGPQRSTGLSFSKTPAYWRVAGVVAGSPAAQANVQSGDLITRINGEAVSQWDLRRYEQLVAGAPEITFTFLNGTKETNTTLRVFDLVP